MPFSIDHHRAARQSAIVIDRTSRARIVLAGGDRRTFLHALLTNDVAMLQAGTGCYAAYLTPQGRMIADMRVFELGDLLLLDVHRGTKDVILTKLDQMLFSEDVQLGDVTDTFGCLSVQGPLAAGVAAAATGADAAGLAGWVPYQNARFEAGGETVIAARVDEFGLPGYLLFTGSGAVAGLMAAVAASGAAVAGPETAEVLRVESGEPEFLVDMTTDTIPLEAGIEARAISYTKGCYPGQEVIVRIRDRGHGRVARRLAGLAVPGDVVPDRGDVVATGDKDTGRVTSAVYSPALGHPIALAYVQRDLSEPGTRVAIVHQNTRLAADVATLPFV